MGDFIPHALTNSSPRRYDLSDLARHAIYLAISLIPANYMLASDRRFGYQFWFWDSRPCVFPGLDEPAA